jgi:hypothetical protein
LWSLHASPHTVRVPTHPVIPRSHASTDNRYNYLLFLIQNSNFYSFMSQTFMLQGSHTGPTPVIPWGGSPAAGQSPTWPPPPPPAGYWPPSLPAGCWRALHPAGHPCQSFSIPPPPSGQGYWPPPPWHLQLEGKHRRGEWLRV